MQLIDGVGSYLRMQEKSVLLLCVTINFQNFQLLSKTIVSNFPTFCQRSTEEGLQALVVNESSPVNRGNITSASPTPETNRRAPSTHARFDVLYCRVTITTHR